MLNKWLGPFEVAKRIGEVTYELVLPASMSRIHPVFHVSLLKKYQDGKRQSAPPPAVLLDGEEENEVQQVLAHRYQSRGQKHKRELENFVKFKGLGPEHSEWISSSGMTNAAESVQDYLDTLERQERPAARVGKPALPAAEPVISSEPPAVKSSPAAKRKRGRRKKQSATSAVQNAEVPKRPVGRPRKRK